MADNGQAPVPVSREALRLLLSFAASFLTEGQADAAGAEIGSAIEQLEAALQAADRRPRDSK